MIVIEDNEPLVIDLTVTGSPVDLPLGPVDLTGAAIEVYSARVLAGGALGVPYSAAGTIVSPPTSGRVSRPRATGDFAEAGRHAVWCVVTFTGGVVRTWPTVPQGASGGRWIAIDVEHRPGT